jgi:nucleoside phosphorylase
MPTVRFGPVASGDKVIAYGEALDSLREVWSKLIGVEMEAGGVALRALQTTWKPGFFMVRGVSDLADEHKGTATVDEWRPYACDIAAAYTIALLKSGPVPF